MANMYSLLTLALVTLCYLMSQVNGFTDDLYENQGFNNFGQQNQGLFGNFGDDLYENQGFNQFLQNQGQFNPFLNQFNPFGNINPFGNLNNQLGNFNNPFGNVFNTRFNNLFDKRR